MNRNGIAEDIKIILKYNKKVFIYFIIMEKERLVEKVKDWIDLENEIKLLQKEIKERRKKKKELTESLVNVMKTNEIDCFDTKQCKLIYTKRKVKAPLSKKHLIGSLSKFFNNDTDKAKELSQYIMNTREEKTRESIRQKLLKPS